MSHYEKHVFFCVNQRKEGESCCNNHGASTMRDYAKDKVKSLGLPGIRVNSAGCLGRCDEGPLLVIYPAGIWYSYVDKEDIDEIIHSHLSEDKIVDRLKI